MEYCEMKRQAKVASCRCLLTVEVPKTSEEIAKMPSAWKRISDGVCCKLAFRRVSLKER